MYLPWWPAGDGRGAPAVTSLTWLTAHLQSPRGVAFWKACIGMHQLYRMRAVLKSYRASSSPVVQCACFRRFQGHLVGDGRGTGMDAVSATCSWGHNTKVGWAAHTVAFSSRHRSLEPEDY
jgi:hypothetical protein